MGADGRRYPLAKVELSGNGFITFAVFLAVSIGLYIAGCVLMNAYLTGGGLVLLAVSSAVYFLYRRRGSSRKSAEEIAEEVAQYREDLSETLIGYDLACSKEILDRESGEYERELAVEESDGAIGNLNTLIDNLIPDKAVEKGSSRGKKNAWARSGNGAGSRGNGRNRGF